MCEQEICWWRHLGFGLSNAFWVVWATFGALSEWLVLLNARLLRARYVSRAHSKRVKMRSCKLVVCGNGGGGAEKTSG